MQSALSEEQLRLFLDHIGLPAYYRDKLPSLELLTALHIHTMSTLPYENLTVHYSPSHYVDLDPQHLFSKMITGGRGRGGYCLEPAILYNHVLRGLGFRAYTAGARTRSRKDGVPYGDYPGWVHIVNIVHLPDGSKYHSDVAFGGDGPTAPLIMIEGAEHQNLGAQQVRLTRDWLPNQAFRDESSRQWIYQYRNRQTDPWNSYYAFVELEFMQPDWNNINHWLCTHDDSNQRLNILIVKFLRWHKDGGQEHEYEISGKRMLVNNVVKENMGGHTRVVEVFNSEKERTDGLESIFGISLPNEDKAAIVGSPLSLGS